MTRTDPRTDTNNMNSTLKEWMLDTIPLALGIQKIPDLLPDKTRRNEIKLALPAYCQTDTYSCGAIAGWSVVEFLHPAANFKAFYGDCAPHRDTGTSTSRLTAALRKHGIAVSDRRNLDFNTMKQCLLSGSQSSSPSRRQPCSMKTPRIGLSSMAAVGIASLSAAKRDQDSVASK